MNYLELAEQVWGVYKHKTQWNIQDNKKVKRIEKILQDAIEKELEDAGFSLSDNIGNIIKPEFVSNEILKPGELSAPTGLENVFDVNNLKLPPLNADQKRIADLEEAEVLANFQANSKKLKQIEVGGTGEDIRYFITVICSGVRVKPNFQLFKGDDIKERDIQTDELIVDKKTYYFIIDTDNRNLIGQAVENTFIEGYISSQTQHPLEWIPIQYTTIWQNRTKI